PRPRVRAPGDVRDEPSRYELLRIGVLVLAQLAPACGEQVGLKLLPIPDADAVLDAHALAHLAPQVAVPRAAPGGYKPSIRAQDPRDLVHDGAPVADHMEDVYGDGGVEGRGGVGEAARVTLHENHTLILLLAAQPLHHGAGEVQPVDGAGMRGERQRDAARPHADLEHAAG